MWMVTSKNFIKVEHPRQFDRNLKSCMLFLSTYINCVDFLDITDLLRKASVGLLQHWCFLQQNSSFVSPHKNLHCCFIAHVNTTLRSLQKGFGLEVGVVGVTWHGIGRVQKTAWFLPQFRRQVSSILHKPTCYVTTSVNQLFCDTLWWTATNDLTTPIQHCMLVAYTPPPPTEWAWVCELIIAMVKLLVLLYSSNLYANNSNLKMFWLPSTL